MEATGDSIKSLEKKHIERHLAWCLEHFWPGRLANAWVWFSSRWADAHYLGSAQTITVADGWGGPGPFSPRPNLASTKYARNRPQHLRD